MSATFKRFVSTMSISTDKNHARLYPFKGSMMTLDSIAEITGRCRDTIRKYFRRHGELESMMLAGNHRFTLDENRDFDRCLIQGGYRSLRHFCKANGLPFTILYKWRLGKPYYNATLDAEIGNPVRGLPVLLLKVMECLGRMEWELFPTIFDDAYYARLYRPYQESEWERKIHPYSDVDRRIRLSLKRLPCRYAQIFRMKFGMDGPPMSYEEIGAVLGLTKQRIGAIVKKGKYLLSRSPHLRPLKQVST